MIHSRYFCFPDQALFDSLSLQMETSITRQSTMQVGHFNRYSNMLTPLSTCKLYAFSA